MFGDKSEYIESIAGEYECQRERSSPLSVFIGVYALIMSEKIHMTVAAMVANSGKYSLVVMGAYGKSGKIRIGSLLEDVVGNIEPPVMIVR